VSRRRFLLLAAGLGGAAAAGSALGRLWPAPGRSPVIARITDGFRDLASARAVGRAYLEAVPAERSVTALLAALERDLGELERLRRPALRDRLANLVRRDFTALEIVNVRGWILSRTEGRLCALAALGDSIG
jgi:hypothetical protein